MLVKLKEYYKFIVYWFVFFAFQRLLFLLFNISFGFSELLNVVKPFWYALRIDLSVVCYFSVLLFSVFALYIITCHKVFRYLFILIFSILILVSSIINAVDILLYQSWKTKLNYKVIPFIETPQLMLQNIGQLQFIYFLFILMLQLWVAWILWNKWIRPKKLWSDIEQKSREAAVKFAIVVLFSFGLMAIGIRGGLQQIPINPSSAFHHVKFEYNYAALNSIFNLMYNIHENKQTFNSNPYIMLSDSAANQKVKELFAVKKDTSHKIFQLGSNQPNIVFIVMEGINANVLNHHGMKQSYMPFLDSMIHFGLYFDACYATGFRTDQGLPAILSGYPSQPYTSIVTQLDKLQHLPTITSYLHKRKYTSMFCFGGEPEFGNIKSYLIHNQFKHITAINDFPILTRTQQLGVPDHITLDTFYQKMKNEKKPFFAFCLTQSTHEPYDIPVNKWTFSEEKRYAKSCRYLDSSLAYFFSKAAAEKWFRNTIFIITADHAHIHPGNYQPGSIERFHIPFLIISPLLKPIYVDSVLHAVMDQTDIPLTLLKQLNYRPKGFKWSKNYFNPYQHKFTFNTFINGQIFKNDTFASCYEYRFMKWKDIPDSSKEQAKYGMSLMQLIMNDYLNY